MALTKLFTDFFNSEKAGGLVLIACTVISLLLTNFTEGYAELWHMEFAGHHLAHWINDGLMVIFFLLIGLELEREIYIGELSTIKNAALPAVGALGGMVVPALLFSFLNFGTDYLRGFGIPMATDIAFALGVLSLLGNKVPTSLKVFLTALAVIDDLGAIIIIAIFYTHELSWINLGIALGIFGFLLALNRLRVHVLWPYLIAGVAMWYFMLHSGVHATITGVLLAFAIPFGDGSEKSPSYGLQHFLHRPVAFFILPVFALANTSIILKGDFYSALGSSMSLGIMIGLIIGKPAGIFFFSMLSKKLKWVDVPAEMTWRCILGAGLLGGIGFTMSIFISLLAFDDAILIDQAKIAVMVASILSGICGFLWLKREFA